MSTGDEYNQLIEDLNKRGLLDDGLKEASLTPPDPSYVAPLYAYLVSDAGKGISGRTFWAAGGYVGQFHRSADELIGFKNHDKNPPWTLNELHKKLATPAMAQPDELYNLVAKLGIVRVLVKQKLLVKIGNSALVKKLMS